MQSSILERFEQISNVPTNNLVSWMETTQYNNDNYKAIDKWTPVSSAPSGNFFENTSNDKNQVPYVKTNVLNGNAVLRFTPNRKMTLNNLGGASSDFTMLMVTRQVGKSNQRFIQGNNNSLFGYWGGRKEAYHNDTWSCGDEFFKNSDSNWDIFTIRRSNDAKMSYFNSMGTPIFCKAQGNGLNGLNINTGGASNETSDAEIAEFILYKTCLSDSEVSKIESYLATKWGLLAQMDPNVPGSTNTAANNVGGANATAPSSASNFPVTNVKVWADASTIPNATDGAKVSAWNSNTNDKEFNFNTSAGNPIIKMNVLNKMPVLQFDAGSKMKLNKSPALAANKTFSLAFVTRQLGGSNGRLIGGADGGNTLYGYYGGQKNVYHSGSVGWVYAPGFPNSASSDTNWDIYIITRNYRGFASMMRNNKVIFTGKPAGNEWDSLGINAIHETSDGQVAEIIMWDRCLNMAEIPIVSTYLIKKCNLQLSLDKNDPLYAEGVQIKEQRDKEAADAEAARLKAIADAKAAAEAAEAARLKAIADAQAAAEAAAAKKQAEAAAAAQKQIDDARKALEEAVLKEKKAAEAAAAAAAEIQAKQQAALDAAKKQDEELKRKIAEQNEATAKILAEAKAYADQQKIIQAEALKAYNDQLAETQQKAKLAAVEQAAAAAAIAAKQQAAIEAAKKQDEELRKQLANEQASMAEILAAAKAYAEKQKLIAEDNAKLFNSKLISVEAKNKIAADEQASIAKAIQAKQEAAILASQGKINQLQNTISEQAINIKQLVDSSKVYAEQQNKIAEENKILWTSKLVASEESLVNKTNLFNIKLASTISEEQTKLKSAITLAENNLQKALADAQRRENDRVAGVISEEGKLFKINLNTQEESCAKMINQLNNQKLQMQESNSSLLKSTLLAAQEKLAQTIAQNDKIANDKYRTLEEVSNKKQYTLSEQLIKLQDKYNTDIYTIAEEAGMNYNGLQKDHITKITNLQNQLTTASNALADTYNKYRFLQEETSTSSTSSKQEYEKKIQALSEAASIAASKAINNYNELQKLNDKKYNALQEASQMIASKAVSEYNALQEQSQLALKKADQQYKNLEESTSITIKNADAQLRALQDGASNAAREAYAQYKELQETTLNASRRAYQEYQANQEAAALASKLAYQELKEREKEAELANKKKIDDLMKAQQDAMKKVIATTKEDAVKVAKGKAKKSSKKGSTKKTKKGSKKASTKKGSTKKAKKTSSRKKTKEGFTDFGEASISAIAKAVAAVKKALA